ncbi:hypothetical protein PR202_ga12493 [Eleusine coracana subsp. coracana]|uniref:Uncharacterized protein n=1 Tax=Eleusine coracana subsp. coracana TaxID=191504 RepID=A0AAV5CC94_ELECO|nr:hypothetical protein PR202_ga12493 [Eleusine coracana subsp. coracana]
MISGQSLHMKLGEGEASYGRNSKVQNAQQNRMKPFIENAVTSLMESADDVPSSVVIADLGCSFGPNALGLVSTAVSAISQHCSLRKQAEPEICVLLNDLPSNDFNSVAKSLVALQQNSPSSAALLTGIVPGSFYKRLFTSNSLNLVLSSNSLHWLSQGFIRREMVDSFYVPMHAPSNNELSKIIDDEGSFKISKLQVHELMHGMDKGSITSKKTAIAVTAIFEPIIVQHFTPLRRTYA